MAKNLLSKKAIKYIVQLRNDEDVRYSYAQIAKLVEENFGVKVCFQTIAYHYQRNKDIDTSSLSEVKPKSNITAMLQQRKAEKQAQVATTQPTPTHTPNQSHLPPSKRVYQAPDMEKLTRMLHMSDDEFREMMRQEAEEEAKNTPNT